LQTQDSSTFYFWYSKSKDSWGRFFEGIQIGTRRVDFFVEDKIMTELKAVAHLDNSNLDQAINYLEAYNLPVGLLLNFGSKKLEFKRSYNTKHPDNAGYVKKQE